MINPHNVIDILANLISDRLTLSTTSSRTRKDEEVASILFENIESKLNCTSYTFQNEDTFYFDFDIKPITEGSDSDDKKDDNPHDDNYDDEHEKENTLQHQFSLEYIKKMVQFYNQKKNKGKRNNAFLLVQSRFKEVKDKSYIYFFQQYIESQGTKKHKLNQIDALVYQSFEDARQRLLSVHDIDLKRWGLKKASMLDDRKFVASDHWCHQFKKRHGIVTRKITKLVTKQDVDNKDMINKSADDFVNYVQKFVSKYHAFYILNTDQSGLQLEVFSNRALSFRGENITVSTVRSVHNTSHSYTGQPIITMSGRLIGLLFLCLKEESGRLSDTIQQTLFKANNIMLTCSKSGKLTGSLIRY